MTYWTAVAPVKWCNLDTVTEPFPEFLPADSVKGRRKRRKGFIWLHFTTAVI